MATEPRRWNENDSSLYRRLAKVAVPDRAEQIATLLTLVPYAPAEEFSIVELGCGEGLLGEALLTAFANARYLGLDGSDSMRAATLARLSRHGAAASTSGFDLADPAWLAQAEGAGLVVSSLCVHHLDDAGKQRLFAALGHAIAPEGALLIADIVAPARAEAGDLFAGGWDASVDAQSQPVADGAALREAFAATRWNVHRYPDPIDTPSVLFRQLQWLAASGFAVVDCFWMRAGHAIYGGYRTAAPARPPVDRYTAALRIGETVLAAQSRRPG